MLPNAKQSLFSSGYPTNVKTRPATYNSQILDDYYRGERYGDRYGSSLDYQINKPPAQVSREYIPIEKKEIEYVPQQKIEYFPVERDYVDYLEIEHQRDYIPIPKLNRYTDYVPVERYDQTIDYLPYDKSQVKGYNGSSRANGSYGNYSGRGYPNEFRQRSAYGNYQGYSGYQGYGGGISGYPVNPSYGNPYLGLESSYYGRSYNYPNNNPYIRNDIRQTPQTYIPNVPAPEYQYQQGPVNPRYAPQPNLPTYSQTNFAGSPNYPYPNAHAFSSPTTLGQSFARRY